MSRPDSAAKAFTLVELMVSITIVTLLLVLLVSMTNATTRAWSYTSGRIEQFRDAREGFENITRQLSQATLNTYLDYRYDSGSVSSYARQSELRFICGNLNSITGAANYSNCPTHAVFFQAPLGVSRDDRYSDLGKLLNTCGYYIQYGSDKDSRPDFLDQIVKERYRFRLMEMLEPSESLTLYDEELKAGGSSSYLGTQWFTVPLNLAGHSRVVAENIVALVVLPKLSSQEDPGGTALCPRYYYDSTRTDDSNSDTVDPALNWKNQLPPVIQITMIAVDEASFGRIEGGPAMPDFGYESLFETPGDLKDAAKPGYAKDITALTKTLREDKLSCRVFTTDVAIKAAKWSRDQNN